MQRNFGMRKAVSGSTKAITGSLKKIWHLCFSYRFKLKFFLLNSYFTIDNYILFLFFQDMIVIKKIGSFKYR